jgi:hypothetical protein
MRANPVRTNQEAHVRENGNELGQLEPSVRRTLRTDPRFVTPPPAKEIPYDYVTVFRLQGTRGNRIEEVINISVDGAFVAVSIGYSFIPARLDPRVGELNTLRTAAVNLPLGVLVQDLFQDPRVAIQQLLVRLVGIDFKYTIVDSSTGRELQNLPLHNIAGLGEPTGQRPFQPMPKPILFLPRSTIRIVVEEISEGALYTDAELFIALKGYKILGYGL